MKLLSEKILFEMANLPKKESGLPYDLWIDSVGSDRAGKHGDPLVKIKVDNELIPILINTLEVKPSYKASRIKELPTMKKFIKAAQKILISHWKKELTDLEALTMLKELAKKF